MVPREMPRIVPRACGSQSGAPRPVSAGTKTTPPESGTERASASLCSAEEMMPSPSRNHWMAAPVTKIAPSSAYSIRPSGCCQATVESSPCPEGTGADPVCTSTNEPVP